MINLNDKNARSCNSCYTFLNSTEVICPQCGKENKITNPLDIVPKTFDEAIKIISDSLSKEDIDFIMNNKENDILCTTHHSFGQSIRNKWGLWHGSDLRDDMEKMGFMHADDMSSTIIKCIIRDLKKQPREVEKDIQHYKDYWAKLGYNSLKDLMDQG